MSAATTPAPVAPTELSDAQPSAVFPVPSASHEACPRCAAPFHCGATDPRCDCFDLQLSPALRQQLAAQYSRCLCLPCLRALQAAETSAAPSASLPSAE